MQFRDRDADILKWINGFGFATADQIQSYMGVYKATCYARLKKLVEGGYLSRERILHGQARIHKVTKKGTIASGDHIGGVQEIRLGTFRHDLRLVDLALELSGQTGGTFVPQRQIRHDEGLSGVGQFGHVSDGHLYIPGEEKPIAIELELSVKARSRLNSIINRYGADLSVKEIWYYTDQQSVRSAIEKASHGYSFIKVFDLDELKAKGGEGRAHG